MSVTTVNAAMPQVEERVQPDGLWLRDRNWDTLFMTMSVFLVPMPYLFYLLGMRFGVASDIARNAVNLAVALLVGGPHMYATFMRTALDDKFIKRYPMLIRSSIIIPIVVVSLAFLNLTLLLTIFFFWASIHVLHQVTYIVELYNHRQGTLKKSAVTMWSRAVDYALILTCLFPIASLKISHHNFKIGANDLTAVIPNFFFTEQGGVPWFFILMTSVFTFALVSFPLTPYQYATASYTNLPNSLFLLIT